MIEVNDNFGCQNNAIRCGQYGHTIGLRYASAPRTAFVKCLDFMRCRLGMEAFGPLHCARSKSSKVSMQHVSGVEAEFKQCSGKPSTSRLGDVA